MFYISGFYKFKKLKNIKKIKKSLQFFFIKKNIKGTIIISNEGINGTVAAKKKNLELAIKKIKNIFKIRKFDSQNLSKSKFQPFHRGKAKIKKEVVPMGIKISKRKLGNHLEPLKWNKLIKSKNTFLIDARKPFEYNVGTFKGAINPKVDNFSRSDCLISLGGGITGDVSAYAASIFKRGLKFIYIPTTM